MKRRVLKYSMVTMAVLAGLSGCGDGAGEDKPVRSQLEVNGGDGLIGGGPGKFALDIRVSDGNFSVRSSGKAETTYTTPTHEADLGKYPAVIDRDTIVVVRDGDASSGKSASSDFEPSPYYLLTEVDCLMVDNPPLDSEENDTCVTGIKINSGVKLTLQSNSGEDGLSYVRLRFDDDVIIDGTLVSVDNPYVEDPYRAGIDISAKGWIVVGRDGMIDARGVVSGNPAVRLGVDGEEPESNVSMVISGTVDLSGDALNAGKKDGGDIVLELGDASLYIDGSVKMDGENMPDDGGEGGSLLLSQTGRGGIYISGRISAAGGDGNLSGGSGGEIGINGVEYDGDVMFSGEVELRGGASLSDSDKAAGVEGGGPYAGGNGGVFILDLMPRVDRKIALAGTISSNGGKSISGDGGNGGLGFLVFRTGTTVEVSTSFSFNGGSASRGVGGDAGGLLLNYICNETESGSICGGGLNLLGYGSISFSGGEGVVEGGAGGRGYFTFSGDGSHHYIWSASTTLYGNGGDAVDDGQSDGVGGKGGDGGTVRLNLLEGGEYAVDGNVYLHGGRSWGDVNNSDGGEMALCLGEDTNYSIAQGVVVDLSAGSGGSGEPGEDHNITVNSCDK